MVHGRQILFSGGVPVAVHLAPTREDAPYEIVTGAAFIRRLCTSANNPVATPTAVVRTAIQRAVGGYAPSLPHTNDMEMWLRLAAHGDVGMIHANQALKRQHAANMQLSFAGVRDLQQRRAAFDVFFDRSGDRVPERDLLMALARERLAIDAVSSASHAFDRGDTAALRELLDFAAAMQPEIIRSTAWSRLAWKLRIGTRVWAAVRPIVNAVRG